MGVFEPRAVVVTRPPQSCTGSYVVAEHGRGPQDKLPYLLPTYIGTELKSIPSCSTRKSSRPKARRETHETAFQRPGRYSTMVLSPAL